MIKSIKKIAIASFLVPIASFLIIGGVYMLYSLTSMMIGFLNDSRIGIEGYILPAFFLLIFFVFIGFGFSLIWLAFTDE